MGGMGSSWLYTETLLRRRRTSWWSWRAPGRRGWRIWLWRSALLVAKPGLSNVYTGPGLPSAQSRIAAKSGAGTAVASPTLVSALQEEMVALPSGLGESKETSSADAADH